MKKTTEIFKKEIKDSVGNEYNILEDYINNKTKITFIHNKCGYKWKTTPHNFLNNGTRCPKCSGKYKRTDSDFKKEIKDLVGNEYSVLSEYKSDGTKHPDKVKFKHNICNNIFEMRAHDFLKNAHRCPVCANKKISEFKLKSNEDFLNEIEELVGKEYTFLDNYTGCRNKIKVIHNKCKKCFYVTPKHFLYDNTRCPFCKRSKGEEYISKWLKKNNYEFQEQFKINDCKYKLILPFDFKIKINDEKFILLEYDGIQHFKKCWYDTDKSFEIRKLRDSIKNDYCKKNSITLVRIPYNKFNVLEKELKFILEEFL